MDRAHPAGKRVVYWTLNRPSEITECLAAGADGFFTDDVELACTALRESCLLTENSYSRGLECLSGAMQDQCLQESNGFS